MEHLQSIQQSPRLTILHRMEIICLTSQDWLLYIPIENFDIVEPSVNCKWLNIVPKLTLGS